MAEVNLVAGEFGSILIQDPLPVTVTDTGTLHDLCVVGADEAAYVSAIFVANRDDNVLNVALYVYDGTTNRPVKDYVLVQKRGKAGSHFNILEGAPMYVNALHKLKVQVTAVIGTAAVNGVTFTPSWTKMTTA